MTAIPAPTSNPSSVINCFEKAFGHEVSNTKATYSLVKLSHEEEDWATSNFFSWFVKEQTEEVNIAISLLDKIKIADAEKATIDTLYLFDKDLENTPDDARLAQEITTDNP